MNLSPSAAAHLDIPAVLCAGSRAARLWPGRRVRVIDWSTVGVLIEAGVRFAPGRTVTLELLAERGHLLVRGEIVRAAVAAIGPGGLRYRAAIAFNKPVDFSHPREAPRRPGDAAPGESS